MKTKINYQLGLSDIIVVVIGIFGYIALDSIMAFYGHNMHTVVYSATEAVWVAVLGAIYGPVVGGIVGFVGAQAHHYYTGEGFWAVYPIGMLAYGFIIGRYSSKYGIRSEKIGKDGILIFELVQVMAAIIVYALYYPLLSFITLGTNVYELIYDGMHKAGASCIVVGILLLPIFFLTNKIYKSRHK